MPGDGKFQTSRLGCCLRFPSQTFTQQCGGLRGYMGYLECCHVAPYVSRWSASLSFAAARAVAASLLSLPLGNAANVDGAALDLSDVLAETFSAPPLASRLPLRASP